MIELRQQLEKERSVRMILEDQVRVPTAMREPALTAASALTSTPLSQMRVLDAQLYPEKLKAIAQQVQDQQSLGHLQQHKQLELDSTPAHSPQVGTINMAI